MRRKRSGLWTVLFCVLLISGGLGGMVALLIVGLSDAERTPETRQPPKERIPEPQARIELPRLTLPVTPLPREVKDDLKPQPKRTPIAGAPGYSVVVNPDGTSYLDGPEGRQELVDRTQAALPDERELNRRIGERLRRSSKPVVSQKEGLGQLVVLDEGVVDIPKGLIITFTASDRLVVLNEDGASTVYHVNGKIERRERDRLKESKPAQPRPPPPKPME